LAWERVAGEAQQRYAETWGSRKLQVFLQSERTLLETTVGLALFGSPNKKLNGYTQKQVKIITKFCDIIVRKNEKLCEFGTGENIVYFCAYQEQEREIHCSLDSCSEI
jgi:hypothetical protein